ncbi:MAG: ERF family protein, partial [Candidatus Nanopelagicaceae bacterium]
MKQIATALLKAQTEMSNPKKGSTNPFFKSKYADLNSIREASSNFTNCDVRQSLFRNADLTKCMFNS